MTEEIDTYDVEDFLRPACYMDDVYEVDTNIETGTDCENLYALPC